MLDNAIIFEKAFARLNKENKQFKTYFVDHLPPTETDWRNARRVIHFLKIFHKVTVRLSGSLHVTSSAFFHEFVLMQSKLKELAIHGDPTIAAMADHMKKKFSKYWEDKDDLNNLLFIALILDPRYKVKFLSFFFLGIYGPEKKTELMGKIEGDLRRLFDCYVESVAYASLNSNYNQPPLLINVDEHEEDPSMLLASQFATTINKLCPSVYSVFKVLNIIVFCTYVYQGLWLLVSYLCFCLPLYIDCSLFLSVVSDKCPSFVCVLPAHRLSKLHVC
jgi:hypothetical protein